MTTTPPTLAAHADLELRLLLEAINERYHYDFRRYAADSMHRRLARALPMFSCRTLSGLQERLLHDPAVFPALLPLLTVQVSDMFRDPAYYRGLRERVMPVLATYPSLKLWVAGCSTGEEVYSLAILLREEGLLDRSIIYATDISADGLARAEAGVYALDRVAAFSTNYQAAGGRASLSDYYTAAYGAAAFDKTLRRSVVFSDHSLATDSVFAEVHLVSCRNVLIYFARDLQERAVGLFREALCRKGFLGLGARETLQFSRHAPAFIAIAPNERIYQRC
jgi:chemotaxis protein methyltransferase CheR